MLNIQLVEENSPSRIGNAVVLAETLVNSSDNHLAFDLMAEDKITGKLTVFTKKIVNNQSQFGIELTCNDVKNIETVSKTDPFVRIFRPYETHVHELDPADIESDLWKQIYETEHLKNNLNPTFSRFEVSYWDLCRGNPTALLKFEIWDDENMGDHKKVGTGYSTLERLMNGERKIETKGDKGDYTGTIRLKEFSEQKHFSAHVLPESGITVRPIVALDCSMSLAPIHTHPDTAQ